MPASPSDGRGKWKRRKRDSQINRRFNRQNDAVEDDDDENPNDNNNNHNHLEDSEEQPHNNYFTNHETEIVSDGGDRISHFPSVVKRTVNRPHSMVTSIVAIDRGNMLGESVESCVSLENISYGQLQVSSAVPADSAVFGSEDPSCVVKPPKIVEGKGVVKRFGGRTHVIPMHSDWFSPSTVHRLERQAVPHFFSGKSPEHTPEKYMECRNHIVAKYMENPKKRLTASECQGLVAGVDYEDLTRIVRFLDNWGIINYCAAASSQEIMTPESYLKEDLNGEIIAPSAALKSIDSLIKFERPKCKLKPGENYSSLSCPADDVSDLDKKIREQISENHCHYCSKPVPIVYYQSQKEVDVLLCSNCFHEGKFVIGHSSLDFVKMDSTNDYGDQDGDKWTDQETLLLLQAVEIYNDNWNDIADCVGSKSKAQCILHFLRLPIEDGVLDNIEVPLTSVSSSVGNKDDCERQMIPNGSSRGPCRPDADSDNKLPFANSPNPVMKLVAFLASFVGPRVAAACAHAALAVMSEDDGRITRVDGQGNRMNTETVHDRSDGSHGENANSVRPKEESSKRGSRSLNEAETVPLSAEKVKAAAKAGLAAAATKAKMFADHEEREIQRLSANIINHQFKRLEVKLKQFAELEGMLMKECEQVERTRQRFAAERARIMSSKFGSSGVASPVGLPSVASTMGSSAAGSSRQQAISAPPSQPAISGFNSPQPIHPHMPFMPRQPSPMYGFGPRLPLTAIQSSTTPPPPNVMFHSPGNSQPAVSHSMLRPVSGTSSSLG